ncbi:DNA topoisomerase [Lipomyces oligophaga]|uniref:DNA topoisomerase n=1 Tax=Lipomyces oligophaga TaxID=45792 RepID=UPI0034CE6BF1
MRVLCVAEKPSIAKSVASTLGGGRVIDRSTGSKYIKNYDFTYNFPLWGETEVTMTSVVGHITTVDFVDRYKSWQGCSPGELFHAQIITSVDDDKRAVASNIRNESRSAQMLIIWTDCDREGEHIGLEVVNIATQSNRNLIVKRAMFNNIEPQHIRNAANSLRELDRRLSDAVEARIEIDLRLGAAFTRYQTLNLGALVDPVSRPVISYGSCQFPTLGFIVDRFKRVQNFRTEEFWYLELFVRQEGIDVGFSWGRNRLFDRLVCTLIYENCLESGENQARVVAMEDKQTSKWRPLPLTTVELQRRGSLFLGMSAKKVMDIAEKLYTKGFISYPRTETDQFAENIDLRGLIQKQTTDARWGSFANSLLCDNKFQNPRRGRHDDHAHPPIHPVIHATSEASLSFDDLKVYELVTRHFLACCSDDAKGASTEATLDWAGEYFHASGLRVMERNYLDVYIYDRWSSSRPLPNFAKNEIITLREANLKEGKTTAPRYLTEPGLIRLMEANGIGTDATMAEHIEKILSRQYAVKVPVGAVGRFLEPLPFHAPEKSNFDASSRGQGSTRGRGRGASRRGGGGGRGPESRGTNSRGTSDGDGQKELIPTALGYALVEGYDAIGFDKSLTKPLLRKDLEIMMSDICVGRRTKQEVVRESIEMYEAVFNRTSSQFSLLQAACKRYVQR